MHVRTLTSRHIAPRDAPDAAAPPRALLVVAHGRGDSLHGFTWLPDALDLPHLGFLLLNAPDPYWTGFSWYDLPPRQGPGIARSRALLDAVFDEAAAQGVAPASCVFFGFSQGALLAFEWGARTRHRLAGFVGVSGYVHDVEALATDATPHARATPWLVTHGTEDDMLPFERTAEQVATLRDAGGLPLEFHAFDKAHTIDPEHELPLLRAWIAARLPPPAGG